MKVTRIDPKTGLVKKFSDIEQRIKEIETKPSGEVVIRDSLRTYDPITGVETILGTLPDGSNGFQPFVGDVEPPPIPTAPIATEQPGTMTVYWDGAFVASAEQPKDFQHVNVLGHKVEGGIVTSTVFCGVIRLANESVIITTDVANVGETWKFSFTSEDYNKNTSVASAFSPLRTMQSAALDSGIADAIEAIEQDIISAASAASSAQNAANTAQSAANSANEKVAAVLASGASLTINGDFEASTANLGWMFFSGTSIGTTTGTARSGTKVLVGTLAAANRYAYTDYIAGATGRTYYVEYYARLRAPLVAGNEALQLGAYFSHLTSSGANSTVATYGTGYGAVPMTLGGLSTSTWTKFSTSYTVATADVAKMRFGPRLPGVTNLGDTLEIDDFKVIDVTEAALAQTKADQAFAAAVTASSAAGSAQATADSKNRSWNQTSAPPGTGHSEGDMWFDTDDGNKLYLWKLTPTPHWEPFQDAAIRSAQQAATGAQATADGKNKNYYQPSKPAGTYNPGDQWFDTDDGYKLYLWQGAPTNDWVSFQDGAISALSQQVSSVSQTANGKNTVYWQTTQPTGGTYKVGDQWFDTDDNYKLYIYKGGTPPWQLAQDSTGALNVAQGKNNNHVGSSAPTASAIGDLWIDTSNGNMIKRWSGSAWVDYRDTTIYTAQATASTALQTANGKNTSYYQTSMPTGGTYKIGDQWFDTDDNYKLYVYKGTGSPPWELVQDSAGALALAGTKNKSSLGSSAPSSPIVGDIWIDTGNDNQLKRWNGTIWADARDTTILAASNTASAALNSANGKNKVIYSSVAANGTTGYNAGDTWFRRDGSGFVTGQWEFTTSWQERKLDSAVFANIDAGLIAVGTLNGDRITAGTIAADKVIIGAGTNMLVDPGFLNTDLNTVRLTGGSWTVSAAPAEGNLYYSNSSGANNDFKLDNNAGQTFLVDPKGEYTLTLDMEGPNNMQAYLLLSYTDGTAASGPTIKSFSAAPTGGPVGARDFYSVSWKMSDYKSTTNNAPVKAIAVRVRRTSAAPAGTPTKVYSAKFSQRVTGELIVDGAIRAGSAIIATGAIGSAQIGDAQIKNANIENEAVTNSKILNLDVTKVVAAWLTAGEINANAIKTPMLAVSDPTNFAPSLAEDISAWTFSGGMTSITTSLAGSYDKRRFRLNTNSAAASAQGPYMAVVENDSLYAEGTLYRTGVTTNNIYLRYQFYDSNKTYLGDAGKMYDGAVGIKGAESNTVGNMSNATTHKIVATVPAGAMYARLCVFISNATANDLGMYSVRGYRRFGGTLLVDGAIVAGSGIIGNLAVDTAQIANGAITTLKVTELDAAKIQSGFILADRFMAGSIGVDKVLIGVGYNMAYNGSAQQMGAVAGVLTPSEPTAGYSSWIRATSAPPTGFSAYWTSTAGQGTTNFLNEPAIPVKPNTAYRVKVWVKANVAGSKTYLEPMTGSTAAGHRVTEAEPIPGTESNPQYAAKTYAFTNVDVPTSWTLWESTFRTGFAPAQTMYFRWFTNHTNGSVTNSVFSFTGFELIEMTKGELLVNGSILTQHMSAGTIDAGVLVAGSVKALHVGAKEIGVDKLLVTSTDNMIQEGDFSGQGRGWYLASDSTGATGWSINSNAGRNSSPALQVANQPILQESWSSTITGWNGTVPTKVRYETPVGGNQTYRLSAWVKSTVVVPASGARILVRFKNQNNVATFASVQYVDPVIMANENREVPASIPANVWTQITGMVTTPADNTTIAFGVQSASNLTSGTMYFDLVTATRASNGELIVDGTIKTQHMIAGTIDASILSAGSIKSPMIEAKSIEADRLVIASTDSVMPESDFTSKGVSWGGVSGAYSIDNAGGRMAGTPAFKIANAASQQFRYNTTYIPVEAPDASTNGKGGSTYRAAMWVKASVAVPANGVKLLARWKNSAGSITTVTVANSPSVAANTWFKIIGTWDVPFGAISATFGFTSESTLSTGDTFIDSFTVTRAGDANLVVDGAIDGKVITGPTIQSVATANRGIKLVVDTTSGVGEFMGFDTAGNKNFSLTSAGVLKLKGDIESGSTITGATFKTATGTGPRIEIDTINGLRAYGAGTNNLLLQASSAGLSMQGELLARGKVADYPDSTMLSTILGPLRYNEVNDDTTPALYFLRDGKTVSSLATPNGYYPPSLRSNGNYLGLYGSTEIGHQASVIVGGPSHNGEVNIKGTLSVGIMSASGGAIFIGDYDHLYTSMRGKKVIVETGTDGLEINGKKYGFAGAPKTGFTLSGIYTSYGSYEALKYSVGAERVHLSGLVGVTTGSVTLVAGQYYTIANMGTTNSPATDQVFRPAVGPSMSPNLLIFVRANGLIEYYSPTAQTLTQSAFYIGFDGLSWQRKA